MPLTVDGVLLSTFAALATEPYQESTRPMVRRVEGAGVLLTAPHATRHWRTLPDGTKWQKVADARTGAMAEALANATGATALITGGDWGGDANSDPVEECGFKQEVRALITEGWVHSVIDLHGMKDAHGVDVVIGNGHESVGEMEELVMERLDEVGLSHRLNLPFAGSGAGTVRTCAVAFGARSVQLEIARCCREPQQGAERTEAMLWALARIVSDLSRRT